MDSITAGKRTVRRFVSPEVGTNMYVMTDGSLALVVDSHNSEEALSFLKENGVTTCTDLLTHEHPDHTCGLHALQRHFSTTIVCQRLCGEAIASLENNRPTLVTAMLSIQDSRNGTNNAEAFLSRYEEHTYHADIVFDARHDIAWCGERFHLVHTPGHSRGSCCIIWNGHIIFTGDSLLHGMPVITRLPGGSTSLYRTVTVPFLNTLDKKLLALPGHGAEFGLKDLQNEAYHVGLIEIQS